MQIHVYAKGLIYPPGLKFAGQRAPYIGRKTVVDPKTGEISHPAIAEGFECQSESAVARKIRKRTQLDGNDVVWPADEQTARFLGVPFVPVELGDDGEFHPVRKAEPTSTAGKSGVKRSNQ